MIYFNEILILLRNYTSSIPHLFYMRQPQVTLHNNNIKKLEIVILLREQTTVYDKYMYMHVFMHVMQEKKFTFLLSIMYTKPENTRKILVTSFRSLV